MIWKGKEGYIARNGLTIFPWYLVVLKLTRRFVLSADRQRGTVLTIDLRRDHSMYRPIDFDGPDLTCRNCFVVSRYWIGSVQQPREDWPNAFCSGKRYRWSSREGSLWTSRTRYEP